MDEYSSEKVVFVVSRALKLGPSSGTHTCIKSCDLVPPVN
jgi:hypothetical protein